MRAVLAAALALSMLVGVVGPHVHVAGGGAESCTACILRHTDEPRSEAPDVAPRAHTAVAVAAAPVPPPAAGAPLGAIPGQSPPAAA